MGDVNNPFCHGTTEYTEGCIYNVHANTYTPDQQPTTLKVEFDEFSKQMIQIIRQQDKNIPLVSVLFSGRPMLVEDLLEES